MGHSSEKKHSSSSKSCSRQLSSKSSSSESKRSSRASRHSQDRDEDDWTGIPDPDERRRIQNRIAQRKFREKARETRESAQLADSNARAATYSYTPPKPSDLNYTNDNETEGLPWGSMSMRAVMSRSVSTSSERDPYNRSAYSYTPPAARASPRENAYPPSTSAGYFYTTAPSGDSQYVTASGGGYTSGSAGNSAGQPSPGAYSYAGSRRESHDYERDDGRGFESDDLSRYGYSRSPRQS